MNTDFKQQTVDEASLAVTAHNMYICIHLPYACKYFGVVLDV